MNSRNSLSGCKAVFFAAAATIALLSMSRTAAAQVDWHNLQVGDLIPNPAFEELREALLETAEVRDNTERVLKKYKCLPEEGIQTLKRRLDAATQRLRNAFKNLPGDDDDDTRLQAARRETASSRLTVKLPRLQEEVNRFPRCKQPEAALKLYQVGTLRKRPGPPDLPREVGLLNRPPVFDWSGFYIGANGSGNFNTLGQTERFKMTNAVTNDFSDSSSAIGGGFEAGYLFPLWNKSVLVGLFGSVDFPNQSTNRTFANGFFLGQNTNVIGIVGPQVAFAVTPEVLFYGQAGVAVADVDHKLNFSGPVTLVNKTVTGASLGLGVAFRPTNWQIAGIPVAITAQYNHIFLPRTTFDNPGSPLFLYSNQSDIDQFKIGVRVEFNAGRTRIEPGTEELKSVEGGGTVSGKIVPINSR